MLAFWKDCWIVDWPLFLWLSMMIITCLWCSTRLSHRCKSFVLQWRRSWRGILCILEYREYREAYLGGLLYIACTLSNSNARAFSAASLRVVPYWKWFLSSQMLFKSWMVRGISLVSHCGVWWLLTLDLEVADWYKVIQNGMCAL